MNHSGVITGFTVNGVAFCHAHYELGMPGKHVRIYQHNKPVVCSVCGKALAQGDSLYPRGLTSELHT